MGLRRVAPVVPGSLVAVTFGVTVVELFDPSGVAIVGHIDSGLPSVGLPDASLDEHLALAGSAVGVALVGFAEGLGAAKTYAARLHYEVDANREMVGLGAANVGAGLCSGMVVNGSLSKTAVNGSAGANSQVSGLIVAGLTIVTLLLLTGLFESLPEATLAAVVIAAVIELVDVPALRRLYRVWTNRLGRIYGPAARADFIAAIAALLGVLVFDTLPGLFIGIAVSLVLLLYRSSRPNVAVLGRLPSGEWVDTARSDAARPEPGVTVLRVESGLFFANSDTVRRAVLDHAKGARAVVIDAETIAFVDVTASDMLRQLSDELTERNVKLLVAHDIGQVRDVLRDEDDRLYPTVEDAVRRAR